MLNRIFYYNTIRKIIIAFGTIFSDIQFNREDKNGNIIETIPVPLIYSPKEKFIQRINNYSSIDGMETRMEITLPRMGFEMTSIAYAPERKTNTMEKIIDKRSSSARFMYNRVPYNMTFSLYIATRKFDDSLRIVEQILPYFTPEFTVKIIDKEDFEIATNIPFVLDASDFEIDADGDFNERRTILWTLQFTARAYLYAATRDIGLIKKTIVDISHQEIPKFYEEYLAEVDPLNAGEADPHTIKETIRQVEYESEVLYGSLGSIMNAELS